MSAKLSIHRLSRIKTRWTMVFQAHQRPGEPAAAAQQNLVLCYYRPVYFYLRGMLRDVDAAEELTHEFCVRFLRGDFRGADPLRGRFRDLVKTAARNLALDYWRRLQARKKNGPHALGAKPGNVEGAYVLLVKPKTEALFVRQWRQSLLVQAWQGLARLQKQTGSPYFSVLRYKANHPKVRSAQLARRLSARRGRRVTTAGVRQLLCRARQRFADCLVAAVARSLLTPSCEDIERELVELKLLNYCKEALARLPQPAELSLPPPS
jgi:DNA-directed RNA polymerase specialized sigma24 family protein